MLGFLGVGGGAWRGLTGASMGWNLFDLTRGSSWFPLSDLWDEGLIGALKAWSLYIRQVFTSNRSHLLPNKLGDPLGVVEILK